MRVSCLTVINVLLVSMAGADVSVPNCTCDIRNLATCSTVNQDSSTGRTVRSYRPHGSLARVLYDKQKADEQLEAYDKTLWYKVDRTKIREDLLRLWIPLGAGPQHDQPDKTAEIFLMKSVERSDSLPLQAWHSLARSALSWFISRTSINGCKIAVYDGVDFEDLFNLHQNVSPEPLTELFLDVIGRNLDFDRN